VLAQQCKSVPTIEYSVRDLLTSEFQDILLGAGKEYRSLYNAVLQLIVWNAVECRLACE
jgi:hypothetical protein